MYTNLNKEIQKKINFIIVGKPNSGKSTLFNKLLNEDISPTGETYGLTKDLYTNGFTFKDTEFIIHDTPGLRRKNKINDKFEELRNKKIVRLIDKIDVAILLIDSTESITKQDFRIADIVLRRKKILFIIFNKIDLIDNQEEFKKKIKVFFENSYSQFSQINTSFISLLLGININKLLNNILRKKNLCKIKIKKIELNNFILRLKKESKFPKVKNIEVKAKYIVQTDADFPKFKVFLNTKKKAPSIFIRYFENEFRKFFSLKGVPIHFQFISSVNPYSN